MKLSIFTPSEVFDRIEVDKVVAENARGSFALLPKHIDMATSLVPSILSYTAAGEDGREHFVAVDRGMLVKVGQDVLVSVRSAFSGQLGELREKIISMTYEVGDKEREAQTAVARLEASFVRSFLEFGKNV